MDEVLDFVAIIVGLAVADLLISFHRLMRRRDRVKWHWASLATAALVLLTLVMTWWSLARPRSGAMTIGEFLPTLLQLIIAFVLAAAVLPDEVPEDGIDLGAYYDANGSYIWTLYACWVGVVLIDNFLSVLHEANFRTAISHTAGDAVLCALLISLALIRRRWWHAVGLAVLAIAPLMWLSRSLS